MDVDDIRRLKAEVESTRSEADRCEGMLQRAREELVGVPNPQKKLAQLEKLIETTQAEVDRLCEKYREDYGDVERG